MAWVEPITWTNILSNASHFNEQIRDNLLALKAPPTAFHEVNEASGDYSTNSSTYSDIDSDLSFTFTTSGGDVLIGFTGSVQATSGAGRMDISIDGTRLANNPSGGVNYLLNGNLNISFCRWVRGLAAGSHTFTLQYMHIVGNPIRIPAGFGTASYDLHPRFWVREVS